MMRVAPLFMALTFALPLGAQTAREQASDALSGVGSITNMLTNQNMEDTVIPFETASPDEAQLSSGEFDDRMFEIKTGESDAGRAYGATVDSALTRPVVDLGEDPLALADDAVAASEAVTSGLFEGDSCETQFDGQTYSATRQCTRDLSDSYQSCPETRLVTVDRTDSWSCLEEEPLQTRVCNRDVSWSCNGLQGQACTTQALIISGAPVWNAARTQAQVVFPSSGGSSCQLRTSTFTIQAKDWLSFSNLTLDRVQFNGAAQVIVDGEIVWTSGQSSGRLQVGTRDCGKRCSRQAAYAGGTWIEDCSATARDIGANVDFQSTFASLALGPSIINAPNLELRTGQSKTVTVEVLRVNTQDAETSIGIEQQSSCCSSFLAEMGAQC
jgi:hypothetical protein